MSSEKEGHENPTGKNAKDSTIEIVIGALATLLPFVIASIPILASDYEGSFLATSLEEFSAFFSSGELVLPVFAVCGAIVAAIHLSPRPFPRPWSLFSHAVVIAIVLFGGLIVGRTQGFSIHINDFAFWGLWILYGILLALWWYMRFLSRMEPDFGPRSDENAQSIVDASQRRKES